MADPDRIMLPSSRAFRFILLTAACLPCSLATAASLADLTPPEGFRVPGQSTFDRLGSGLDQIGDFNNDGFGDVAIGVPSADRGARQDAGEVLVVFGSGTRPNLRDLDPDDLDGSNGLKILGPILGNSREFGSRIAGVGDLNSDGFDDVVVSNYGGGSDVWVILGRANFGASINLDSPPAGYGYRITDGSGSSGFASSLSALDLNSDGRLDLAIGDTNAGSSNQGRVYVLFGQSAAPGAVVDISTLSPTTSPRRVIVEGEVANSQFGAAHAAIRSYNGDNIDDLVIGAPGIDIDSGRVYVVFGRQDTSPGVLAFAAVESLVDFNATRGVAYATDGLAQLFAAQSGSAIAVADFNANGVLDIAIGAPFASPPGRSEAGAVLVLYGLGADPSTFRQTFASHLTNIGGVLFQGSADSDQLGAALSAPGDFDKDGAPDLLMASPFADRDAIPDVGRIHLVPGRRPNRPFPAVVDLSDAPANLAIKSWEGEAASHSVGSALAARGGDIDGDGLADLLVAAPNADLPSAIIAGAAYVIFGQPAPRIFCNGFESIACSIDP